MHHDGRLVRVYFGEAEIGAIGDKAGAAVVGVGVGFGNPVPSALATNPITPVHTHPISPVITAALRSFFICFWLDHYLGEGTGPDR